MNLNPRIVLVGFSGAGKSTLVKRIATYLGFLALDTDKMLEEKYRISVYDIFEKYGEEVFRQLEYNTLKEALQHDNVVIAAGGGTPCFFDAMTLINESSLSIYIEMSPKSLTHRLFHAKTPRPLTKNKTKEELFSYVSEQLSCREPFFKQAHFTIKGENLNFEEISSILNK